MALRVALQVAARGAVPVVCPEVARAPAAPVLVLAARAALRGVAVVACRTFGAAPVTGRAATRAASASSSRGPAVTPPTAWIFRVAQQVPRVARWTAPRTFASATTPQLIAEARMPPATNWSPPARRESLKRRQPGPSDRVRRAHRVEGRDARESHARDRRRRRSRDHRRGAACARAAGTGANPDRADDVPGAHGAAGDQIVQVEPREREGRKPKADPMAKRTPGFPGPAPGRVGHPVSNRSIPCGAVLVSHGGRGRPRRMKRGSFHARRGHRGRPFYGAESPCTKLSWTRSPASTPHCRQGPHGSGARFLYHQSKMVVWVLRADRAALPPPRNWLTMRHY